MSNKSINIIIAVLITLVVAGSGSYMIGQRAGKSAASVDTTAVATVNGQPITKTELYTKMAESAGAQTVDNMINEKLLNQAADKAGIKITPADIDSEIAKIKERVGGDDALTQALAGQGMTMESLKQNVSMNLLITRLVTKDTKTDDAALQSYFMQHINDFDQRQIHAREIVVATLDEANAIKAELDKGGDFAALAKAKSTAATKDSGGDLGTIGHGSMPAEVDAAAFGLKVNEISKPIQSSDGFHIVQVLEIQGAAPVFDAMKDKVKDALLSSETQAKGQPYLDDLRSKAKINNTFETKTNG